MRRKRGRDLDFGVGLDGIVELVVILDLLGLVFFGSGGTRNVGYTVYIVANNHTKWLR